MKYSAAITLCSFVLISLQLCICENVINNSTNYQAFTDLATMPYKVSDHTATAFPAELFNDGLGPRIYIIGGCVTDQVCVQSNCFCQNSTKKCIYYLPRTDSYKSCEDMPINRYRHQATRVGNFLYVSGGRTVPDDTIIDLVIALDVTSNKWSVTRSFTLPQSTSDAVAFSHGDNMYIPGGYDKYYNSSTSMLVVNTLNNSYHLGPSLNYGRGDTQVVNLHGRHYVLGGFNSHYPYSFCAPSRVVESFDPASNVWVVEKDLGYGRGDMAADALGGYVFAIAGETKNAYCNLSDPVPSVERFDDVSDSWLIEQAISSDRFRFIAAAYNDTQTGVYAIYLFGGQGNFNPATSSFPLLDTTIKYVPYSLRQDSPEDPTLTDGAIAGVVIGAFIAAGIIVLLAIAAYFLYFRHKVKHTAAEVEPFSDGWAGKDVEKPQL